MSTTILGMSIPYILWSAFLISLQTIGMTAKHFAKTLETEAPTVWESLGRPTYEGGKTAGKEFGNYLLRRQYLALNNKAVNRAGLLARSCNAAFVASIAALVLYYVYYFLLMHQK